MTNSGPVLPLVARGADPDRIEKVNRCISDVQPEISTKIDRTRKLILELAVCAGDLELPIAERLELEASAFTRRNVSETRIGIISDVSGGKTETLNALLRYLLDSEQTSQLDGLLSPEDCESTAVPVLFRFIKAGIVPIRGEIRGLDSGFKQDLGPLGQDRKLIKDLSCWLMNRERDPATNFPDPGPDIILFVEIDARSDWAKLFAAQRLAFLDGPGRRSTDPLRTNLAVNGCRDLSCSPRSSRNRRQYTHEGMEVWR